MKIELEKYGEMNVSLWLDSDQITKIMIISIDGIDLEFTREEFEKLIELYKKKVVEWDERRRRRSRLSNL